MGKKVHRYFLKNDIINTAMTWITVLPLPVLDKTIILTGS